MATIISGARILTPDESIESGDVRIGDDGRIAGVAEAIAEPPSAVRVDMRGATLVPGFIDLHVHGGGGFSLATNHAEEIRSYARWVVRHGVTSFLATICAESVAPAMGFVRTAASVAGAIEGGATLLGINLEGPFVSPDRGGALPASWISLPDGRILEELLEAAEGNLRLMTVAPEVGGAGDLMRKLIERGIVVSVGHSDSDYAGALAAFRSGASHVTHAFNAMRQFHHRDPGPIGAALESPGVTIEMIADGVHLHPAAVRLLVGSFGAGRIALVTDGVAPAGLDGGVFRIGEREARLREGRMLLDDGTIAGSAATMDGVVRNLVTWNVAGLADAVTMASAVPARVLGLAQRKGRLATGFDADIVALDDDLNVIQTWVGGRAAYSNRV